MNFVSLNSKRPAGDSGGAFLFATNHPHTFPRKLSGPDSGVAANPAAAGRINTNKRSRRPRITRMARMNRKNDPPSCGSFGTRAWQAKPECRIRVIRGSPSNDLTRRSQHGETILPRLQPVVRNFLLSRRNHDNPLCWARIRDRFNCPHPAEMAVLVEIPAATAAFYDLDAPMIVVRREGD